MLVQVKNSSFNTVAVIRHYKELILFKCEAIADKNLRGYKIILIFNIKTDKDNTFVTPPEII
jgi:hypothetical protein